MDNRDAHDLGIAILASVIFSLVWYVASGRLKYFLAEREFRHLEAYDRIIVSLNLLSTKELRIRTILERPLANVVPNAAVRGRLVRAARASGRKQRKKDAPVPVPPADTTALEVPADELEPETVDTPILDLPPEEYEYVLNCVLNATAEHYSQVFVRQDAGRTCHVQTYVMFLCSERAERRYRKIRAVLLRRDTLENFVFPPSTAIHLESEKHRDRLRTLSHMAERFKSDPNNERRRYAILELGA